MVVVACWRIVVRSCGCVVVWLHDGAVSLCGWVIVWSCGRVVVWSCGCVVVWLCDCMVMDEWL